MYSDVLISDNEAVLGIVSNLMNVDSYADKISK